MGTVPRWDRVTGSKTMTALERAQETNARSGLPANTTSAGPANVFNVATTRRCERSSTLIDDEMKFTTHSSFVPRNRSDTGSIPTEMLPDGAGELFERLNNSTRPS